MTTKKTSSGRTTPKKDRPPPAPSFREILDMKEPNRLVITLCVRPALTDALGLAHQQLAVEDQYMARLRVGIVVERAKGVVIDEDDETMALSSAIAKHDQAKAARDAAQAAVDESSFTFVLQALGNTKLDELMRRDEHLPTRDQQDAFKKRLKALGKPQNEEILYNDVTFPPALVAACCIAVLPGRRHVTDIVPSEIPDDLPISPEEATEMWESDQWSRGELGVLSGGAWSVNEAAS